MELSYEDMDYKQRAVNNYNNCIGTLVGYDCIICKNKGNIAELINGNDTMRDCKCMQVRHSLDRIERSGLKHLMADYIFDNYKAIEPWQAQAKDMAIAFTSDYENKWFFAGGQVGCGKTHLCTAIVGHFLKMGKSAKYMLWRDEVVPLKALVTDDEAYVSTINKLKRVGVLYIDDFFKTERGKNPSTADINIAFELLNYRYNNSDLITIISSEMLIDDIIDIDEAVGSRIYQKTKDYCLVINYDRAKNYRLRG